MLSLRTAASTRSAIATIDVERGRRPMRTPHRCQIAKLAAVAMLIPTVAFVLAGCGVSVAATHAGKGRSPPSAPRTNMRT